MARLWTSGSPQMETYAYHWERRCQTGQMYRWDNAPHYPNVGTYPAHFHDGDEFSRRRE